MIDPKDLQIDLVQNNRFGNLHIGSSTAVKVTYLPLMLSATCGIHKSQHRNRETAINMLLEALTEV